MSGIYNSTRYLYAWTSLKVARSRIYRGKSQEKAWLLWLIFATAKNGTRSILTQIISTPEDAYSLSYPALCKACAFSLQEMEQGRLSFRDSIKRALNVASLLQIVFENSCNLQQEKTKNLHIFIEGTCSHDTNLALCKHSYLYCWKEGRMNSYTRSNQAPR